MKKKQEEKITLEKLNKDPEKIYGSFCAIYGARNTGKTTIVFDFMFIIKDLITQAYVISQSASANNQFKKVVPNYAIKSNITEEWFKNLLTKQKILSKKFRDANEIENLYPIYKLISSERSRDLELTIKERATRSRQHIRNNAVDTDVMEIQLKKVDDSERKALQFLYRTSILEKKNIILRSGNLSEENLKTLYNMEKDPSLLIVFDDCASIFDEWTRKNPEIGEIIYNGRHYYTTLLITTQDDSDIAPKFRKQATYSIFTDPTMANSFFSRSESRNVAPLAKKSINFVWNGSENFWKLVYTTHGSGKSPFNYMTVGSKSGWKIGNSDFWRFCEKKEQEERKKLYIESRDYN